MQNITVNDYIIYTELTNASKSIGEGAFKYLTLLKNEKPDTGEIAGLAGELRRSVMILLKEAEVSIYT